jgi:hypothetical protein
MNTPLLKKKVIKFLSIWLLHIILCHIQEVSAQCISGVSVSHMVSQCTSSSDHDEKITIVGYDPTKYMILSTSLSGNIVAAQGSTNNTSETNTGDNLTLDMLDCGSYLGTVSYVWKLNGSTYTCSNAGIVNTDNVKNQCSYCSTEKCIPGVNLNHTVSQCTSSSDHDEKITIIGYNPTNYTILSTTVQGSIVAAQGSTNNTSETNTGDNLTLDMLNCGSYSGTVSYKWKYNGSTYTCTLGTIYSDDVKTQCTYCPCPAPKGGVVSPSTQTICLGVNKVPQQHMLSGYFGTILRWEYQTPNSTTWNNWGGTSTTAPNNCCFTTAGTWKVRAVVKYANCTTTTSSEANIIVEANSVGGNISPASGSVCWNNNCPATPAFSISGNVGSIVRWEYMRPGEGWTNWGGAGSTTAPGGCFNVSGQWRFRAIAKNGSCGETTSQEAVWNVNPVPVITPYSSVNGSDWAVQQNVVLCQGGSFRLHPHPTTTSGWVGTGPSGFSSTRRDNDFSNAQSNQSGVYTFTHTDANGCSSTTTYNVTVNSVPDLLQYIQVDGGGYQNIDNIRVCEGQTIVLDFCCDQALTFSFRRPDGAIFPGGTNGVSNDQILFGASGGNLGVWQATYSKNGCSRTENFTVSADPPSIGGSITGNLITCDGNISAGQLTLTGQIGSVVRWEYSRNNGAIWNDWGGSGTTGNPVGASFGDLLVRAVVKNGTCPEVYSNTVTIKYQPSLGGNISPLSGGVCWNNDCPLTPTFSISGNVGSVVRWEYMRPGEGWTNWGGAGSTTAPGGCFNVSGQWRFRAIVKNGSCNEVASQEAVWNANPVPVITPYSNANGSDWAVEQNVVLCQGGSFRLHPHPTTTSGWIGIGPSGFSSTRRDNDFSSAQPNQSGVYTFTHTDANGCSSTTTYNVTVNSVSDLLQYIQVDGGGYQNIDNIRVCEGQAIVLDFCCDQALTFSFRRPDGAVFPGGQNGVSNDQILFTASGVNLGVWQATYSKNGCFRTENFTVSADPPSVGGNISPLSGSVCWNNDCPLTPTFSISGNVGSIVRWEYMRPGEGWTNWGGASSTTAPGGCFNVAGQWRFRAIVKSGLCNEVASQEAVWNADSPSVGGNISPSSGSVCWNNDCPLTPAFSISGNVGNIIRWEYTPPGGSWTNWGGTGSTTSPWGCFSLAGQWRFRAIVKNGICNEVASQEAVWNANPVPVITTQPTNQPICQGSTGQLSIVATGATIYQWKYNNGSVWQNVTNGIPLGATYTGEITTSLSIVGLNIPGSYQFQVLVNTIGCSPVTSSTATIQVIAPSNAGTGTTTIACKSDISATTDLFTLLTGEQIGGTWASIAPYPTGMTASSINSKITAGILNLKGLPAGAYSFRYTVMGTSPCLNDTEDVVININTCCPPMLCLPTASTRF